MSPTVSVEQPPSIQMIPPSSLMISQGWGLMDLAPRATFLPAHPLARRDVPSARARVFRGRALREHRRSSGSIPLRLRLLSFEMTVSLC